MDKQTIQIIALLGGGVVVGATVGVLVTRDHFKTKYEARFEEELRSVKAAFSRQFEEKDEPITEGGEMIVPIPQTVEVHNHYTDMLQDQGYVMVEGERFEIGGDDPSEDPDHEAPTNEELTAAYVRGNNLPDRIPGNPFVITVDEYMQHDEYDKVNLSYYDEDGVLADERERIVHNTRNVVGDFVPYFGVGSNDPLIVYIQNDRLKTVFEIVKDEQSYAKLVLKMQETEENPIRRRMRDSDE